ncbi:MAG: phosphopentomutase [Chthoniobacter sp.]|nr:phosphopentomutase [Chthoniobacter sp.]
MRALLLVLDSVGCGRAPDAAAYGDAGADTLGHILAAEPAIRLPTLLSLGLGHAIAAPDAPAPLASHGRMRERSAGKDTTTGHWEIAGVILDQPFATYPTFPAALIHDIERDAGVVFLGNYAQSGTTILDELGPEHLRTGRPILYTSADSVLQIAAHESVTPLPRLYEICHSARRHADAWRIGRVIARPFTGEPGAFRRTSGRHDFSAIPPRTVLNAIAEIGLRIDGVGKISDIFAGSGITASTPTSSNAEGMAAIEALWATERDGLIFANLVDFDMLFGHRRDVAGYARALAEFDHWLATFIPRVATDDLVIITADHGNDPTWRGTDHTREEVPLLVLHRGAASPLGTRRTFADIAATLAAYFHLPPWNVGESFLPQVS